MSDKEIILANLANSDLSQMTQKFSVSKELSNAVNDFSSFSLWIEAYAEWSRKRSGVPTHYKCLISRLDVNAGEKEIKDSLPILTDADAEAIDKACAYAIADSALKRKLFEVLIISGWDCVDAFSIPVIKRLIRKNGEKLTVQLLESKRRDLIESARNAFIYLEDNNFFI